MEARLTQIENTTLAGYLRYRPADRRFDEKRGQKDGERESPDAASKNYPFRATVLAEADAALRAYGHKVEDLVAELEQRRETLQQDLEERYAVQRDEIEEKYKNELEHVEQRWGPNSVKHSFLRNKFAEMSDRQRQLEAELGRPLRVHLKYWYVLIMTGVVLVEIPINRFAFELYFAETPALSFLIALGVGFALMLLAHYEGTWLKRSTGRIRRAARVRYIVGIVALAVLMLPTIFLIALLRQHYVQFIENQQVSFAELLQQGGLENLARDVISTGLGTQGWMLFMINLLVVGIGILVAVVRHDSHPDYERIVNTRNKLERKLNRVKMKLERASSKVKREYESRLSLIEKQQERIAKDIETASAQRQKCIDHKERMLERVVLHIVQRLNAYETGNETSRKTAIPSTFWCSEKQEIRRELEKAFVEEAVCKDEDITSIHALNYLVACVSQS